MNIFVGNLSFDATEHDLKKLFEGFGSVVSVVIVMDKNGKKSRGFGFIEMLEEQQGHTAITALDGQEFMGRPLKVSPSQPKSEGVRDIGDKKERLKRIKAEKRQLTERIYRKVRPSASKRREQPNHWEKRESSAKPKPWQKREGSAKPWQKREDSAKPKPWEKRESGAKPWVKRESSAKPWQKREGAAKPWQKKKIGGYKK
jgi:RNA recognition motif-containing protein